MLKECERNNQRSAIILNELGDVNVENSLFEGKNVQELLNGCICCTMQEDLKETLVQFIIENEKENIDVLFIEGTGVANPLEIEETLISPNFLDFFELCSMISVVDASGYIEYQSIFSSTSEVRKLLKEQISSSTIVLLNKTDLMEEKSISKIEKKLKETIKDNVPVYRTKFGEGPLKELFLKRYHVHVAQEEIESKPLGNCSHSQHKHHHSTINAIRIDKLPYMNKIQLEKWLKKLPKTVLRGKGIVKLEDCVELYHFQFSSGNMILEKVKNSSRSQPTIILIGDCLNVEEIHLHFSNTFKAKNR